MVCISGVSIWGCVCVVRLPTRVYGAVTTFPAAGPTFSESSSKRKNSLPVCVCIYVGEGTTRMDSELSGGIRFFFLNIFDKFLLFCISVVFRVIEFSLF